jgi:hypothetical protein
LRLPATVRPTFRLAPAFIRSASPSNLPATCAACRAFFLNGDEVLVVQEGSEFLNRYRLDKIGNDSADVEETSSGRHATVQMVQPANNGDPGGGPPNP